jgi:glucose/mannose transport system substrate-binding protein
MLANAIMDPAVQTAFNIEKGSIPAVVDAPTAGLDACALKNVKGMAVSSAKNTLLPTVASTHATGAAVTGPITDVVTRHFNSDMSSADAAKELSEAVEGAL